MAKLRPFQALRPAPEKAHDVSAVPYDVVNREEAAALAQGNPLSFLHVSRPEIDLPLTTDPHSDAVYDKARANFDRLKREAPLTLDTTPRLYLYRLRQGTHEQIGIAATFSIEEYDSGIIQRHERTRRDKEDDRTRHLLCLGAQTGPAYLTYRETKSINELVSQAAYEKPLYEFTASDGVTHTLWQLSETSPLIQAFESVPRLYIADGHHRTASASRAHAELKKDKVSEKDPAHAYFLAVAFPAEQLRILPYHRVVKDLNGLSASQLLEKLSAAFEVKGNAAPSPEKGSFAMYLEGNWYGLRPRSRAPLSGIASLDVSILQDRVLSPLLGIQDPRTDRRIDFVGGVRGTGELEKLVDTGRAQVAFSVHPTTLEDLMRIADADEIMPPKSTWFEPKLRDGLLTHLIV
jgi:uncharacterized protein (DUF1015 family)